MRCGTIFRSIYTYITIVIIIVVLSIKDIGCHRVRLCHENIKCLEDEKIRIDQFKDLSHLRELDQLKKECNRKTVCTSKELRCEYEQYSGMMLEYSCINDSPLSDGSARIETGTLLSSNYPNAISKGEFLMRLNFQTNVTLTLTFHDVGDLEKKPFLTVYTSPNTNWTRYTGYVTVRSKRTFHNAKHFDISLYAKRVWITFKAEKVEKPPEKVSRCPDNDQSTSNCPPKRTPTEKPAPKSQKWLVYVVVISVLSTIILIFMIGLIWKRCSLSDKCPCNRPQKHSEQRPDILTHFPSDGNIMTGDILAQEFEAAAAAEAGRNRNAPDGDEESVSHYETISVPHYTDFPQRPRPSLPISTCPRLASYIEVLPR